MIVDPPENVTVFIDQSALFTCETDGGIPDWRVNGTQLHDLLRQIREDICIEGRNTDHNTTIETFTIPAKAGYNETKINCLVLDIYGSSVESETAILRIQGNCNYNLIVHTLISLCI